MDIQLSQIIFQIINFGVVVGALTYFLYRPILKILRDRSEKIEAAQKQAQKTLEEKEQIDAFKKKAKSDAEKQASDIIAEARESAEEQRKQLLSKAKSDAKAEIAKLKEQWEEEKTKMARSMQQDFSDAVMAVAEKVMGSVLDKKAHQKLIDQEIKNLIKA